MPFIGKPPAVGAYSVLDALTASATANYSLQLDGAAFVPNSVNQLLVSLNGVIQKPGSSFTVSGSTLTFKNGGSDQALTSSDSIDFIISMGGDPLNVGVVSDGTITNAKITSGIASSKLTGALPALDGSALTGTGNLVSLQNNTTGGTVATLEIDLSTSTDYAFQMLSLRGFCSTSVADMYMTLRKQSNSTYFSDSYLSIIGSHHQGSSSNSSGQNGLWNGSYFRMVHNGVTTDTTHQLNDMNIYFFEVATDKKTVVGADRFGQNTTGIMKEQMSGKSGYADVVDRCKLYMGSGNIVFDEYTLYGFKKG